MHSLQLGLLFNHSVISDSLWLHRLQDTRLPCPSPSPGGCSDSNPLSQWCHPIISSSVVPFFFCLLFSPVSGSFPMSQFFSSDGHCIGASASASVLPKSIQDWFPFRMDWFDLLVVHEKLKSLLQHHILKAWVLQHWNFFFFFVKLSHPYMTIGKTIQTFVTKVMSLFFNTLSRLEIAFLPRRKHLLISWLQSPSTMILKPPKIVYHCSHSHLFAMKWCDWIPWSSFFECWVLSQKFDK